MATQYTKRIILVIPAAQAAKYNTRAKEVDTVGGERTFTVGLSASGKEPATHYWCSWAMTSGEDSAIRSKLLSEISGGEAKVFDGKQTRPEEVLTALGLQRVAGDL